jgi:hypothetical protein
MDAREPRSLPESEGLRVRLRAGLGDSNLQEAALLLLSEMRLEVRDCPARIVPPWASQISASSSSSASSAKTSGSSSSGGRVDIQHMRPGSNIMFPTLRAPDAEPTGDPTEDPVRCVMSAGRVGAMAASNSRRAWSFPSHLCVRGFHLISPTAGDTLVNRSRMMVSKIWHTFRSTRTA